MDTERRSGERRRLVLHLDAQDPGTDRPRRSGKDRRVADRRVVNLRVVRDRREGERREGERRRTPDRRGGERRRSGPRSFTVEEAGTIVRRARAAGPVACPRCGGGLVLRPPIASEGRSIWAVSCGGCRCQLRIENL